jgi:hypothetical protein
MAMTDNHPITPPPELVQEWRAAASNVPASLSTDHGGRRDYIDYIATQAARWGADQELLACGKYLERCAAWEEEDVTEMYNYRRPKPLSLRELALASVKRFEESGEFFSDQMRELEFIRKALEQLDD